MIFMSISKNVQIPHVDSNHTTWQYYKIAVSKEKKEIGPSLWFYLSDCKRHMFMACDTSYLSSNKLESFWAMLF